MFELKDKNQCKWDVVSLGEVMLRFDPEDSRIHSARAFRVYEGGGEYNVARGLSRVFRQRAAVVTAQVDNQVGRLVEDLISQGGVDTSLIRWSDFDGVGCAARNGMYFYERGFGSRQPAGCSDRGHTAVSQLKIGEIDWDEIFAGARWFHTGGIFAGLSETTPAVALEAVQAAKKNEVVVSYDLNYRASLWQGRGGREAADETNRSILPHVDVVFGVENFNANLTQYDENAFRRSASEMTGRFPNLKVVATPLRNVRSANSHDVGGVCLAGGEIIKAQEHLKAGVLDRIGSGDAFASGLIYGTLSGKDINVSLEYGTAHAVLAMTTPGDNSMALLSDIEQMAGGFAKKVHR